LANVAGWSLFDPVGGDLRGILGAFLGVLGVDGEVCPVSVACEFNQVMQ